MTSARVGQWTYACRRLQFPAKCDLCGDEVGRTMTPYYFRSERGQRARYRCWKDRHAGPGDVSSAKAPVAARVAPGSRWCDGGKSRNRSGRSVR